jgi:flagellin
MPISIIYNASATNARNNLVNANQGIDTSIKRLSSGLKIARASDDVAGLAVGTQLQSNVTVLKAAANNVQQANALLAIADGALDNIGQMLQRMLSLASQATSASLNEASRAYLNQEFQGLKDEINRISEFTKFNGISLLDGSFGKSKDYDVNAANDLATIAQSLDKPLSSLVIDKSYISKDPHSIANLAVPGFSFQIADGAVAPAAGNLGNITIAYGAEESTWSVVINALTYTGKVPNNFEAQQTAILTNTDGSGQSIVISNESASNFNIKDQSDADQMRNALEYALGVGTAYASGMDAADVANTAARSLVPLNLIGKPNRIADFSVDGTSFGLSDAGGATAVTGTIIRDFDIQYLDATNSVWSVTMDVVGGTITYQGPVSNTLGVGATANLTATDGSGEILTLTNSHITIDMSIGSQSDANQVAEALEYAFVGIAYANGMDAANIANTNNKTLSDLDLLSNAPRVIDMSVIGSSLQFSGSDASGTIDDFRITYAETKSDWSVVIGGVQYKAEVDNKLRSTGTVLFNAADGSGKTLLITNNTARSMSIDSQVEAERLFAALNNSVKGKVVFQVGTVSNDQVLVGLAGNSTSMLGIKTSVIDDVGAPTSVLGATSATLAVTEVTKAIQTVLAHRAEVGAITSRFDKAFNAISTSAQNQDAARGVYLDADIAQESSSLAAEQVKMNASISVLAQANELTKSLLKLLG